MLARLFGKTTRLGAIAFLFVLFHVSVVRGERLPIKIYATADGLPNSEINQQFATREVSFGSVLLMGFRALTATALRITELAKVCLIHMLTTCLRLAPANTGWRRIAA